MSARIRVFAALLCAVAASATAASEAAPRPAQAQAIFASGCFWCTESDFEKLDGVIGVVSGYVGGKVANPSYEQVGSGLTGHTEAAQVTYDPGKISYEQLLATFWRTHDPFTLGGQFCDHGNQYRPGIYVLDAAQRKAAEASRVREQKRYAQPLLTPILDAGRFWPAEDYHQDYYKKNPLRYRYYRSGCGRDARLDEIHKLAKP